MKCKNCGAKIAADDYFCTSCGSAIEESSSKKFIIILASIALITAMGIAAILFFVNRDKPSYDTVFSEGVESAELDSEYDVNGDTLDLIDFDPVYTTGEEACWDDCTVYIDDQECETNEGVVSIPQNITEDWHTLRVEWVEDDTEYYCERYVKLNPVSQDNAWKEAYSYYIENEADLDNQQGYALIYLDDDDIPELVEVGNCEAAGIRIINYADGKVNITNLWRLGFEYVERGNILNNSNGNMGYYYDRIYTIEDGVMKLIANGECTENGFDANNNLVYKYTWNGEAVSRNEYEENIERIYDRDNAKLCPSENSEDVMSVEEILDEINCL